MRNLCHSETARSGVRNLLSLGIIQSKYFASAIPPEVAPCIEDAGTVECSCQTSNKHSVDTFTKADRSRIMRAVPSIGTTAENKCESLLRTLKLKFSKHSPDLVGRPDFILKGFRLAIFVHGCFWHAHEGCKNSTLPTSNVAYWVQKIDSNRRRDRRVRDKLRNTGWRTVVIWECRLRRPDSVASRLLKLTSREKLR